MTLPPTGPSAAPTRAFRCAASLLRDGAERRAELTTLLDEELAVLGDETGAEQSPAWMPWAAGNGEVLEASRPVLRRLLLHRRLLVPESLAAELEERDPEGDPGQLVAAPVAAGVLLLRRSATSVTTGVRTFMVEGGPRELRWYLYHQAGGVSLEEVVTAEGRHAFAVLPTARAGERLAELVDPRGAATEDGEVLTLPADAAPDTWGHGIVEGTLHLSRLVTTTADAVEADALTVSVTEDGVHLVERGQDGEEEVMRIADVSASSLVGILDRLVLGPGEVAPADMEG